jgi:hypothetical protein
MIQPMLPGAERPLTQGEWSSLSPGLAQALRAAGVQPVIVARPAKAARIAALWRGATPIMALGAHIYWPRALQDMSGPQSTRAMAVLQHELQHVLEYAAGELSVARYVLGPRNWTYDYRLTSASRWRDFGAEQRASIVEHLWLIERRLMADPAAGADHRRVIPWVESAESV